MRQPLSLCLLAIVALAALAGPHPCQASARSAPAGSDCHGEDAGGPTPGPVPAGQVCAMACAATATLAPPLDLPVSASSRLAAVAVAELPPLLLVQPIEHVPLG